MLGRARDDLILDFAQAAARALAAMTNAAAKSPKTSASPPPRSSRKGTESGARIEAMRPNAAAAPAPVLRMRVG